MGGSTPRLLAVDDEPELLAIYEATLSADYTVNTAGSGAEALDLVERKGDFDIALLDRRMPQVSGDDVLARLSEVCPDCRVAMVTAVDPDFDILDMPFDEYLVKPVTRSAIRETVERLVRLKVYRERCREEYALASKAAALRAHKPPGALAESDEYGDLLRRLEALREELDRTTGAFTTDEFAAAFAEIGGRAPGASSSD